MTERRPIFLTNTLGRKLEEFRPLDPARVMMYNCGPTVYSYAHTGNFRAYIFADTLRRVLEYNGYDVVQVRNITDVGHLTNETLNTGIDKMERSAREQNRTPQDIARHFTDAFLADARKLNLLEPASMPRATEYIEEMIELTQRLIDSGHAYVSGRDVYYDVSTYPTYGALSGNSVDDLIAGARVEVGEGKRSPADFALWKGTEPDKLMQWPSPWGNGVPGWHIECSAMSMKLLGEQLDIHTGAIDNIFPHHEDERAQSEAATGKPFVRYWLHNAFLETPNEERMAKSLGNIFTVSDLEQRGIHPLAYRYFTHQAHYRTPLKFSWEALEGAATGLARLWEATAELLQESAPFEPGEQSEALRDSFHEAINRDLDMPRAVAVALSVAGSKLTPGQKLDLLLDFDRVLGLELRAMGEALSRTAPEERELLEQRRAARKNRDWAESDRLRTALAERGLEVKDTARGQRWIRRDVLPEPQASPA
ncbi:MAG TPA: cysteine--tRNA ligase [Chloroflexota bacterium]|nr:cysteine--tRNA ligase [Chloroflexota bacterium]